GVHVDVVGDEADRAVGETDVGAADVIAAGGGVDHGVIKVAAVVAIVIGRRSVAVGGGGRVGPVILAAARGEAVDAGHVPGITVVIGTGEEVVPARLQTVGRTEV